MQKITPCLWFDNDGEEALAFYTSIFKNSRINHISRLPENDGFLTAIVELDGQEFMLLNATRPFEFTDATSFVIDCQDQSEVDYYWDHLLNGGHAEQCGWLRDKFGVPWQIVPSRLGELMSDPNPHKAKAVMDAMLGMVKLDVDALQRAYDSV